MAPAPFAPYPSPYSPAAEPPPLEAEAAPQKAEAVPPPAIPPALPQFEQPAPAPETPAKVSGDFQEYSDLASPKTESAHLPIAIPTPSGFSMEKMLDRQGVPAPGENPRPVVGWLVVISGPGRGYTVPLSGGVNNLGRSDDQNARIGFGDQSISRRDHLRITYEEATRRFYVSPGTSAKQALLNGAPIHQAFPLTLGDRLALGSTILSFVPFCGPAFDWQSGR